jgi:N6-adenosine-specific RNA methylase IME4
MSTTDKQQRRQERELALAKKIVALPTKHYGVLYADPPWRFEPYSRQTGMDRAADNHYPTMTTQDIMLLRVPAAKDCVLFLWATAPMLPAALAVMAAWGFTYKSHWIWNKDRVGTGYWARNKHELLLIGTRGEIPALAPGTQPPSVLNYPAIRHSAKPPEFRALIEKFYPNLPKLELFARGEAPAGWDFFGNEAVP